jgi:hypothetical protein
MLGAGALATELCSRCVCCVKDDTSAEGPALGTKAEAAATVLTSTSTVVFMLLLLLTDAQHKVQTGVGLKNRTLLFEGLLPVRAETQRSLPQPEPETVVVAETAETCRNCRNH